MKHQTDNMGQDLSSDTNQSVVSGKPWTRRYAGLLLLIGIVVIGVSAVCQPL